MGNNKPNIFVARLARHAAASAMVGAAMIPSDQATLAVAQLPVHESVAQPRAIYSETDWAPSTGNSFSFKLAVHPPLIWEKKLEREFRRLALQETKGVISNAEASRLEQLTQWRDQLLCPQTVEETLLQIKRDRLLAKMQSVLEEYVEFQDAAYQARGSS